MNLFNGTLNKDTCLYEQELQALGFIRNKNALILSAFSLFSPVLYEMLYLKRCKAYVFVHALACRTHPHLPLKIILHVLLSLLQTLVQVLQSKS